MYKRYLFAFLVILWSLVIFLYSAKPADESTAQSYRVGKLFGSIFVPGFNSWTEEAQTEFASKIDHPIRKTAHATEYALLGFAATVFAFTFEETLLARTPQTLELLEPEEEEKKRKRTIKHVLTILAGLAFAYCFLYACSDEIHQLFVPGRSGKFTDVLIDSAGALLAVLVCFFIRAHIDYKNKK